MKAFLPALVWTLSLVLERVAAYALAETDAAGQLLSAGTHSATLTIVSVPSYLLLRLCVLFALCPVVLVTIARVRTQRVALS